LAPVKNKPKKSATSAFEGKKAPFFKRLQKYLKAANVQTQKNARETSSLRLEKYAGTLPLSTYKTAWP
jgi:hypothetical protein